MRFSRMIAAALFAILCQPGLAADIRWARSFDEARSGKKLVMVDFYTDWCGWCKRLDATTYKDPQVARVSEQMVNVKVNAEKEGASQASKYGVRSFPTILFLDPAGAVVGGVQGYRPGPDFAAEMSAVLSEHRELPGLERGLKSGGLDVKRAGRLAAIYARRGQTRKAAAALAAGEKAESAGSSGELTQAYLATGTGYARAGDFGSATPLLRKAIRSARRPDEGAVARLSLSACFLQQRNFREATPLLNAVLATRGLPPHLTDSARRMLAYVQNGGN